MYHMDIIRYLDNEGKVFCQFLELICLTDGKADSIVTALKNNIHKKGIPTHLIFVLGTDGVAVMTGVIPCFLYIIKLFFKYFVSC